MKRQNLSIALILCLPSLGACIQKLDRGATAGAGTRAPDAAPTTAIDPTTAPIGTNPDDEGSITTDPCEKTRADKTGILTAYCAKCHSGPSASGLPKFDFVLDDALLVTKEWIREGQPPQRFVIPGDPDHSVLYTRVAVIGDMPAQPSDLATPRNPAPSLSDISILHEWIAHCAGTSDGPDGGTGGADGGGAGSGGMPGGSGGATGSGGGAAGGSGGTPGSGGVSVAPDGGGSGGTTAADASVGADGGGTSACAGGVTDGGRCDMGAAACQMGSSTCTCGRSGGMRQWTCR